MKQQHTPNESVLYIHKTFPFGRCRVLYEGKEQLKQSWYVIETTPYSRSANLSSGGAPTAHRVFLTYRRALDSQGLHTLGVTDIALLLPSKGEVAPHTFCRVDKNLNTGMVRTYRWSCLEPQRQAPIISVSFVSSGVQLCTCATRGQWPKPTPWCTRPVSTHHSRQQPLWVS